MNWNPYSITELSQKLSGTTDWFLDGGYSLELFLEKSSRDHGDIDIGVYSRNAKDLLNYIDRLGFQIYIASKGTLATYDEVGFIESNYNYWVSDGEFYRFQILVYRSKSGRVTFRRNKEITWPESSFIIEKKGIRMVNPLVTYAFKVTTSSVEEKDLYDISSFSNWMADHA